MCWCRLRRMRLPGPGQAPMGSLLLGIWLVLMALAQLGIWSAPAVALGLLALAAGTLQLAKR